MRLHATIGILVLALLLGACGPSGSRCGGQGACSTSANTEAKPGCRQAGACRRSDDLAAIQAAKRVRIGVKTDTPPFGRAVPGAVVGFDIDIAHAVADRIGAETVDLVWVTSADRMARLVAGEVDLVVASMTITRGREREVDFSIPYFQDGQALLVGPQSQIRSYRDLSGKKVGAVKGSTSAANLAQVAPSAVMVEVAGFDALVRGLIDRSLDAATSDRVILIGLVANAPADAGLKVVGDPFSTEPYGIAMRPNQSALRDAVNEALQAMWEDGAYRAIHQTWFGEGTRYAGMPAFTMTPYPK